MVSRTGVGGDFGLSQAGGYSTWSGDIPPISPWKDVTFTSNGRAAFGAVIRAYTKHLKPSQTTVLMPAYLCPTMIQPFEAQGFAPRFYDVGASLQISPQSIRQVIDDDTGFVVLMQYFGFSQPDTLMDDLQAQYPALRVIDDRTHALLSDLNSLQGGGTRIYSVRKWGPFPDLGIIRWADNREGTNGPGNIDWAFSAWRTIELLLRAFFFAWPTETLRKLSLRAYHRADAVIDKRIQVRGPSVLSIFLWRRWNWVVAGEIRRRNFRYLLDHWTSSVVCPLFKALPDNVYPLGFPVRTAARDKLKKHLIEHAIFPPVHWPRPSQLELGQFSIERLYSEELTLPIDQRYGERHMDCILGLIEQFQ